MDNNINIIENTLEICNNGFYYANNNKIKLSLNKEQMQKAVVYSDKDISNIINTFTIAGIVNKKTSYNIFNSDSFDAAYKISLSCPDSEILVLNFANPVNPGGGVRIGAKSQEEDLCRKSTLLLSLESEDAKEYYDFHREQRSYLSSDYMIISPFVEVFRNSDNSLASHPFKVSVLTCAAPIMTESVKAMDIEQYKSILYRRIKGILCLSAKNGYKNLILGAWGCGVFGNDAELVASLFYKAFEELKNKTTFDNVVMAVLDKSTSLYNYKAFDKYFGSSCKL